jgi:16S rRNA (guanine966-N2)-methyltransferase
MGGCPGPTGHPPSPAMRGLGIDGCPRRGFDGCPRFTPYILAAAMTRPRAHPGQQNRLRIIGGRWRGLKIEFPDQAELRPSPDRVRETLFNWLQPVILDARCLDLFAGSGALGIEALSRGAAEVVLVERDASTVKSIQTTLKRLDSTAATVVQADALKYLDRPPAKSFNVIFLDPPYASGALPAITDKLARNGWLAPEAMIYMESPSDAPLPAFPPTWAVHRSRQAGQVGYHLLRS